MQATEEEFPLIDAPDPRTRARPASPGLLELGGSCIGGPFVLLYAVELLEDTHRLQGLTSLCLEHLCSMCFDLVLGRHTVVASGLDMWQTDPPEE